MPHFSEGDRVAWDGSMGTVMGRRKDGFYLVTLDAWNDPGECAPFHEDCLVPTGKCVSLDIARQSGEDRDYLNRDPAPRPSEAA